MKFHLHVFGSCIILTTLIIVGSKISQTCLTRRCMRTRGITTVETSIVRKMSQWDTENGVWIGDKATSEDILPSPLYLFGYGSLLWNPGDLLGNFPSYSCVCSGWQRLFAQRSCDHRGSPLFPGFVATLVEASYLDSRSQIITKSVSSTIYSPFDNINESTISIDVSCSGLVWFIPQNHVVATIAELDYRERGGYHRYYHPVL